MPIPQNVDPNARTRCPDCKALTLAADWRDHQEWHDALEDRLAQLDEALKEPAPEPALVDWPAPPREPVDAQPAGPYAPEHSDGPGL